MFSHERLSPHQRLEAWRRERRLTQVQLGALLGCSNVHASHMVRGLRAPGRDIAVKIELLTTDWKRGPIRVSDWSPVPQPKAAS
jgi:hypothetical protein